MDNGPEFISKALDRWVDGSGVTLDVSRRANRRTMSSWMRSKAACAGRIGCCRGQDCGRICVANSPSARMRNRGTINNRRASNDTWITVFYLTCESIRSRTSPMMRRIVARAASASRRAMASTTAA